jgi:heptosyltransferase I
MRLLVVRLGAFGDIVHAIPAVAALRAAHPSACIDWLVSIRYAEVLDLLSLHDRAIIVGKSRGTNSGIIAGHTGARGLLSVLGELRSTRYDAAIDFQGLLKSAVLARLSGARRVIGFARQHLREPLAGVFYKETSDPGRGLHVVRKNLALGTALGAASVLSFPFIQSRAPDEVRQQLGLADHERFAVLNPAAGWPNKRWPVERFGALARLLGERHGLTPIILWGPAERLLAEAVVEASAGTARLAPQTSVGDLPSLFGSAALMVSGDTGPLHLAAATGTPIVGLYGPTDPLRNGPWSRDDVTISRFQSCVCHHKRRCCKVNPCLLEITVEEVAAAVDRRLGAVAAHD